MLIGERAARVSCPYQIIQGTRGQGDMGTRGARVKLARGHVGKLAR